MRDFDFLTTDYFKNMQAFTPDNREEFHQHLQRIYNLKLKTPFPLVVHIEPTNVCNHKCRMCCHPDMKRKPEHISEELVKKAIIECAHQKTWFLHFFFFGEPFLNKKLLYYISQAKREGIRNIGVTSNFVPLSKVEIKNLANSGIDSVQISFHGIDRKKYHEIHGVDDYFKAKENIEYFLSCLKNISNKKPWVGITYVHTDESSEEIHKFQNYWIKKVNTVHISPQFEYRNGKNQMTSRSIYGKFSTANSKEILSRNTQKRIACRQLWTRLIILSNGEIVPCSQNIDGDLSLGNLQNISISRAWTGQKMAKLRMEHISNHFTNNHPCKYCTDWDWSGRVQNRPKSK